MILSTNSVYFIQVLVRKHKVMTVMAYSTHHTRSPQRQLALFQAPACIFGMSQADRLANTLKVTQDARKRLFTTYAAHCASLGRANALPAQYRLAAKRDAFAYINLCRKALRENARQIAAMQAELLALTVAPGVA